MKIGISFSRVKPVLVWIRQFAASEKFDVFTFYMGMALFVVGCCLVFGAAIALMAAGVVFVLSVKPIERWIK